MKRTKEWWASLLPEERSYLVYLERYSDKSCHCSAYLPDGIGECPVCGQLSRSGMCDDCYNNLEKLIDKANKAMEEE